LGVDWGYPEHDYASTVIFEIHSISENSTCVDYSCYEMRIIVNEKNVTDVPFCNKLTGQCLYSDFLHFFAEKRAKFNTDEICMNKFDPTLLNDYIPRMRG
jgi:hypothetical protein